MIRLICFSVVLLIASSCVEPFEVKNSGNKDMLVVEGVLSNQLKRHQIFLSRTTPLNERKHVREPGATISISDNEGTIISLTEVSPGIYETPEISAQAGKKYLLYIKTANGKEYSSREVPYKDGVDIGNVYGKYVVNPTGGANGVQIYADTEDPAGKTRYYRWSYIETYQVNAPFPSVWVWIGGNEVTFREDPINVCYVTDTLRNVLIRTTKDLELDKITAQQMRYIPETSYIMRFRYSILVQQFCLSEESYLYWDNLRVISEQQGSLSDQQPGSLNGNIYSITDDGETVLGYFDVCRVSEKRIVLKPIDFYNDGFKYPANFRSGCYEIAPILVQESELGEKMEIYQNSMYIWEAYGASPATVFQLMPKTCCDCRDQGPTEKPPFF